MHKEDLDNGKSTTMPSKPAASIVLLLFSLSFSLPATSDDAKARAIMENVDARDTGNSRVSNMDMILIDKRGGKRIRKIHSLSKDKNKNTLSIMFFLAPADVINTAFLTYDYDDSSRNDDQWLYLPALNKTKRISGKDKSGSFMGSDFTYSDMSANDLEDYDFAFKKELEIDGYKTWLIQSTPRNKRTITETGYTKSMLFIRQNNYFITRAIHWVKKGRKRKYMEVKSLKKIDEIWTATEIHMTTKKAKKTQHKTVLKFHDIKYNQNLGDAIFTKRRLEKGL